MPPRRSVACVPAPTLRGWRPWLSVVGLVGRRLRGRSVAGLSARRAEGSDGCWAGPSCARRADAVGTDAPWASVVGLPARRTWGQTPVGGPWWACRRRPDGLGSDAADGPWVGLLARRGWGGPPVGGRWWVCRRDGAGVGRPWAVPGGLAGPTRLSSRSARRGPRAREPLRRLPRRSWTYVRDLPDVPGNKSKIDAFMVALQRGCGGHVDVDRGGGPERPTPWRRPPNV
jgi:hypothetical protein